MATNHEVGSSNLSGRAISLPLRHHTHLFGVTAEVALAVVGRAGALPARDVNGC